jgi:hypothetical protein
MNPRNETTEYLLKEETRLIALIDKLAGNKHFGKNMRGKAKNTLANVQRELNQRAR